MVKCAQNKHTVVELRSTVKPEGYLNGVFQAFSKVIANKAQQRNFSKNNYYIKSTIIISLKQDYN